MGVEASRRVKMDHRFLVIASLHWKATVVYRHPTRVGQVWCHVNTWKRVSMWLGRGAHPDGLSRPQLARRLWCRE